MTMKSTITSAFVVGQSQFVIIFLAIQIDFVTAKPSNMKFIGIRASTNWYGGSLSHNLAVKEYNPIPVERRNNQASDILINWLRAIFVEFNIIDLEDILTSSTNSGSDIKWALEVVIIIVSEWCTSHLLSFSLVDAFRTCVDKNKNKNARTIFSRV